MLLGARENPGGAADHEPGGEACQLQGDLKMSAHGCHCRGSAGDVHAGSSGSLPGRVRRSVAAFSGSQLGGWPTGPASNGVEFADVRSVCGRRRRLMFGRRPCGSPVAATRGRPDVLGVRDRNGAFHRPVFVRRSGRGRSDPLLWMTARVATAWSGPAGPGQVGGHATPGPVAIRRSKGHRAVSGRAWPGTFRPVAVGCRPLSVGTASSVSSVDGGAGAANRWPCPAVCRSTGRR
jgi:hypothetical protein